MSLHPEQPQGNHGPLHLPHTNICQQVLAIDSGLLPHGAKLARTPGFQACRGRMPRGSVLKNTIMTTPSIKICYTKRKGAPGCLCINIKSVLHILLSLGPFIIECFVTELSSPNAHPAGCKVVAEQLFAIQSLC